MVKSSAMLGPGVGGGGTTPSRVTFSTATRCQVLAGFFDGFGVERITVKNTQATTHKRLVHGNLRPRAQ